MIVRNFFGFELTRTENLHECCKYFPFFDIVIFLNPFMIVIVNAIIFSLYNRHEFDLSSNRNWLHAAKWWIKINNFVFFSMKIKILKMDKNNLLIWYWISLGNTYFFLLQNDVKFEFYRSEIVYIICKSRIKQQSNTLFSLPHSTYTYMLHI